MAHATKQSISGLHIGSNFKAKCESNWDRERQAHNLKVVGSNPTPATKQKARHVNALAGFMLCDFAKMTARRVIL
jgi:hypothetical protein